MAEIIIEATENLAEKNLPVYYKYRYTFNKDEDDIAAQSTKTRHLVEYISKHYLLGDKIIAGIEHYTKGMLSAKPHVHIHFQSRHSSDTIRKGLARYFEMIGRCQACKAEILVDEYKFWRYPLKQQLGNTKIFHMFRGYTKEQVNLMIDVANACWLQSAEVFVGKIEKKLEKTAKERLYVYLDSLNIVFESVKQVTIYAYQYFAENEETLCVKTVDGYVNVWLLKNKYISANDLYNFYHPNI